MMRTLALLFAALIVLPAASLQDPPEDKEAKKVEAAKAEEEAKAALKSFREKRVKAKTEADVIECMEILKEAKPHKLIRTELIQNLTNRGLKMKVRIEAADILRKYKKDPVACDALFRTAKSERGPDLRDLRKASLRSYGAIAPFGKSVDLKDLFPDVDTAVAREAIEAVESIKSVRMLKPLLDLLGELERIREDDGGDRGPPVPDGTPGQGDNNSKRDRKKELLDPTKDAINTLWAKHNSQKKLKDYTEANRAVADARADLKKIQDEEDKQDAMP